MNIFVGKKNKNTALPASLTIEAALTLPVFMLFTAAVVYLLLIISFQSELQSAMDEAAKSLSRSAYIAEETDTGFAVNYLTVRSAVVTDEIAEAADASGVDGGSSGLSFLLSEYDEETKILDIVVTYTYVIPFLPEKIGSIDFLQRIRCRIWAGQEISGQEGEESEGSIVYITPSGTVYHTTVSCPYLDLSVSPIAFDEVGSARNKNGSKYTACTTCCKSASYDTVYITDYGTNYHSTLSCTKLKRTVIAVDISEVGGRSACSKCGGQ